MSEHLFFDNSLITRLIDIASIHPSSKDQSLKKFETELGIHHQEIGLPWDQLCYKEVEK